MKILAKTIPNLEQLARIRKRGRSKQLGKFRRRRVAIVERTLGGPTEAIALWKRMDT